MSSRDEILSLLEARGKFSVLSEFHGGMSGYAFRAKHIPLDTEVFLKICDADFESKLLFQEPQSLINATKAPTATNLVRLFDAEKLGDDFVLMAMELADGGSLQEAVNSGIGQADAVRFAIEILHGVGSLHSVRLLHRDIKPPNILLFSLGDGRIPKLGDFGSVAALPGGVSTVSASRHSALYIPPEGWATPSSYGAYSDLYQVGIVLHEMVNGPLPYDLESYLDRVGEAAIIASGFSSFEDMERFDRSMLIDRCVARRSAVGQILTKRPSRPYESGSLKRIIKKATNPDPAKRFGSAVDFIAALQKLDLPNWLPTQTGYEALRWRGWDWQIVVQKQSVEISILRRRSDSANYRRWNSGPYVLSEALYLVEKFK